MARHSEAGHRTLEQRRTARRRALLRTALEHFARDGYTGATIEDICQEAGVGYRAFYDEFGSKQALFTAVFDWVAARVMGQVIDGVSPDIAPEARPGALVRTYIEQVLADDRYGKILFGVAAGSDETIESHRRSADRSIAGVIGELYRSGGVTSDVPTEAFPARMLGIAVTGALSHMVVDFLLDDTRTDVDALLDEATSFIEIVLTGLSAVERRTDR